MKQKSSRFPHLSPPIQPQSAVASAVLRAYTLGWTHIRFTITVARPSISEELKGAALQSGQVGLGLASTPSPAAAGLFDNIQASTQLLRRRESTAANSVLLSESSLLALQGAMAGVTMR